MVLYYPGSFFVAVTLSKRHLARYVRRAGRADSLHPKNSIAAQERIQSLTEELCQDHGPRVSEPTC